MSDAAPPGSGDGGAADARAGIERLLEVMARLRNPDGGCPWDLEQDFATIAPYTIEEAYEVAEAIRLGDMAALRDELGDLLLQVVFHAQMAREDGSFDFEAVASGIAQKMIRRHPNVFGQDESDARTSAPAQSRAWEAQKAAEREANAAAAGRRPSALDGVALALPALLRAEKLQKRAARVGFDWPDLDPVFDKVTEEIAELREALAGADTTDPGSGRGRARRSALRLRQPRAPSRRRSRGRAARRQRQVHPALPPCRVGARGIRPPRRRRGPRRARPAVGGGQARRARSLRQRCAARSGARQQGINRANSVR